MADAFTGEIRIFPFNYAPQDWSFCDGSTVQIQQYAALYSIIGTLYGGDGQRTFKLPNLLGNIPMHQGTGPGLTPRVIAQQFGGNQVGLNINQLPSHQHQVNAYVSAATPIAQPTNTLYMSRTTTANAWSDQAPNTTMSPLTFTAAGGADLHENRQPYLAMNFCICMNGEYPPRPD